MHMEYESTPDAEWETWETQKAAADMARDQVLACSSTSLLLSSSSPRLHLLSEMRIARGQTVEKDLLK